MDSLGGLAVEDGGLGGRPEQTTVIGFTLDAATETVLRDGLQDLAQTGIHNTADIRRGTVRNAIAALARVPTPQIVVVDIGRDERPMPALLELCDVIEPSVSLLVIGEIDDVDLYREITRRAGAVDYLFKPINRDIVTRHFASLITRNAPVTDLTRGGRVISVVGARGGVGASTIAAALAWYLGVESSRHTLLLDADPFIGPTQDWFGVTYRQSFQSLLADPGDDPGAALAAAVCPVRNRLHVLGSPPDLERQPVSPPGAARRIVDAIRMRFNFVIVDLPFMPIQQHRELLELSQHRIIVLDPSLASLRDTVRLIAASTMPGQPQRPTILLNRQGAAGGLRRKQIEDALKRKVDLSLPDLPKLFTGLAAQPRFAGVPKGPFLRLIEDLAREAGFERSRGTPV